MHVAKPAHVRIVVVQYGNTILGKAFDQFAFGKRYAIDRIEHLDVRVADVRHHADPRMRDGTKMPDLTGMIHADFKYSDSRRIGETQNRQGKAHLVVEIARRFADGQV